MSKSSEIALSKPEKTALQSRGDTDSLREIMGMDEDFSILQVVTRNLVKYQ